jgi:hypothetical protein
MTTADDVEGKLIAFMARFRHDPLGYVRAAFAWGEGELKEHAGPRTWQADILTAIGEHLKQGKDIGPLLSSVASGHGIGKSALVSWLVLWALSTCADAKVVVTANTEKQLLTKTWPEVAKWHRLAINAHWFDFQAMSLSSKDARHAKTWRADAIPWSAGNTEAFAGLHNQGRRVVLIFDEASAIDDRVWEVAEGALTDADTEIVWAVFGNPTRNTGRFRECFGKRAHRWQHRQIDSRTVEGTNKEQLDKFVADEGEDSDFVRVRIKGQFPRAGSNQLISSELVELSLARECIMAPEDVISIGVDVARFGDDESVIFPRMGRDCRKLPIKTFRGLDTMAFAAQLAATIREYEKAGYTVGNVYIDETGIGGGVIDRMRQMGYTVIGVNNGAKSDWPVDGEQATNKGAEMWIRGREWLRLGGCLPKDNDLVEQLTGREYGYDVLNRVVLEKKSDMKKRGLASPDRADALFLTFAYPVVEKKQDWVTALNGPTEIRRQLQTDYDPFAALR